MANCRAASRRPDRHGSPAVPGRTRPADTGGAGQPDTGVPVSGGGSARVMARAYRRVDAWLFAPGSARGLAAVRIGLCSVLAVRLARPLYAGLGGQPAVLFRPRSFMHLLPAMPPRPIVMALQVFGVVAAVLAVAGVWT